MKKLQELSIEELQGLLKKNGKLAGAIYEAVYEDQMFWQGEEMTEIFGKENRTYEICDHYSSFYFSLKDSENFTQSIIGTDYLNSDNLELYNVAKSYADKWGAMTYDEQQEVSDEWYSEFEKAVEALCRGIEDQLHEFETVSDEAVADYLDRIASGEVAFADWEVDENGVCYEHITKIYK